MVKYSIIVPVYNVEKYLNKCIDSILGQTLKDFELILVNDGSKDKSGLICDEYEKLDSRVKVIHKENGGVSSARNIGLQNAVGEYITFIDSDDWVENTYLQNLNHLDYDLIINGRKIRNENDEIIIRNNYKSSVITKLDSAIIENLFKDGVFNYCYSKAFKKDLLNGIKFNEELKQVEDTLFVIEYIKKCNNLIITESSDYQYIRYKENTLSSGKITKSLINTIEKSNSLIEKELFEVIGNNVYDTMRTRMGNHYKMILLNLINESELTYLITKHIFKQKYFQSSLINNLFIYNDEGEKFYKLIKLNCPLIFWGYFKIRNIIRK